MFLDLYAVTSKIKRLVFSISKFIIKYINKWLSIFWTCKKKNIFSFWEGFFVGVVVIGIWFVILFVG